MGIGSLCYSIGGLKIISCYIIHIHDCDVFIVQSSTDAGAGTLASELLSGNTFDDETFVFRRIASKAFPPARPYVTGFDMFVHSTRNKHLEYLENCLTGNYPIVQ